MIACNKENVMWALMTDEVRKSGKKKKNLNPSERKTFSAANLCENILNCGRLNDCVEK